MFSDYHFGGYAKINKELVAFINSFFKAFGIGLDLIYTAKLFYGLWDLIKKDYFPQHSRIVVIHSGGMQGNRGMENKYNFNLFTN